MTRLEIAEVLVEDASEALLGAGLDTPAAGTASGSWGLDVRGWAVGRSAAASAVIVEHAGGHVADIPVDDERADVAALFPEAEWAGTSGFFLPLGTLRLPAEFELDLQLRLADGVQARFGRIAGRRASLRVSTQPTIGAIGLTALGRTGSTAVTRLLSSHPAIVAYRPFEYEPRVVTYWLDVLQDLAEPSSFRRQLTPNGPLEDLWWAGARPPLPRRIREEALQDWIGGDSVDALAELCLTRIDGFYRRVAAESGRADARYFVEKLGPRTGALMRELSSSAREIFLVRDFRDVVASIFAFNERRGFQGFGRDRAGSDAEYVTNRIGASVDAFAHSWQTRAEGAHLVRYEDVVARPRETLAGMLEYLGLEAGSATLDAMLESLGAPEADAHRTTSAEDSIGRWQADLSAEVQAACAGAFGPALRQFGYEA
jgi:hypothetical protein